MNEKVGALRIANTPELANGIAWPDAGCVRDVALLFNLGFAFTNQPTALKTLLAWLLRRAEPLGIDPVTYHNRMPIKKRGCSG